MDKQLINIIIAGRGGQGVNTLYKILQVLASGRAIYTKGALFKGGAQRHGSIYAVLRLFIDHDENKRYYSSEVPAGSLDLLLGLEPWETLRYIGQAGRKTAIITESKCSGIILDSSRHKTWTDPAEIFDKLEQEKIIANYAEKAKMIYGDERMANFLIGREAVNAYLKMFTCSEYTECFINTVKLDDAVKEQLINEPYGMG